MSVFSVFSLSQARLSDGRPDMDLATETRRIVAVLDKTVQRAKLVGVLKHLVSTNGDLISDFLSPDDLFTVVRPCQRYLDRIGNVKEDDSREVSVEEESGCEEDEGSSPSQDSLKEVQTHITENMNKDLIRGLMVLEGRDEVWGLVEQRQHQISQQMQLFIKCLQELRDGVEKHVGETALQIRATETQLRESFARNESMEKEIVRLQEELVAKKAETNASIIGKNMLINRHQARIERAKRSATDVVDRRIKESDGQIAADWKASQALQETLKEDTKRAKLKFEILLKEHLAMERSLRIKRGKVEQQLLVWLQKFDLDIGEKQAEEEELQAAFDAEKKQLEDIQQKLDEQEEEYDELMQEKAQYEQEVLEQKLYIFILNRSARRIQRSFRMYKARKAAKKKAKKEKKGKKAKKK